MLLVVEMGQRTVSWKSLDWGEAKCSVELCFSSFQPISDILTLSVLIQIFSFFNSFLVILLLYTASSSVVYINFYLLLKLVFKPHMTTPHVITTVN
jgi:hypothetical protein